MGEGEGGGGEEQPQMQNFIEETHPKRPTTTNPFHSIPKSYEFYFYQCYVFINLCHPNKCAKLSYPLRVLTIAKCLEWRHPVVPVF